MTDDTFNLDEFVSPAPIIKAQPAPEEYNNNDFIIEPVEPTKTIEVQGAAGEHGKDGVEGKAGKDGIDGLRGTQGLSGASGADGVSVVDTFVRDDDLFIRLSDGKLINAGEVRGPQGSGGKSHRGGGVRKDMFVQDEQPTGNDPYMWLQTNVNTKGDFSLWFNQC